jgi:hypothetical protein
MAPLRPCLSAKGPGSVTANGAEGEMALILLCLVLSWLLVLTLLFSGGVKPATAPMRQTGPEGSDTTDDHRLVSRLRNHRLLMAYLFWKAARRGNRPPRLADIRWQGGLDDPHMFIAAVENPDLQPPRFRYIRVGSALEQRLGHGLAGLRATEAGAHPGNDYVGSLEGAYRRCARTLTPSYEYANYNFGDGAPMTFERLILPLAGMNGRITHLIGVVLFSEQEKCPDGSEGA